MLRLNKEYKIELNDKLSIKYGTVNRNHPIVIYLSCRTWVCPTNKFDFENQFEEIKRLFKKDLKVKLSNNVLFENKFICDFDYKVKVIKEKKKNFLSFEIFLKQKENNIIQAKLLKDDIVNIFNDVINNFVDNMTNNSFSLSLTKHG